MERKRQQNRIYQRNHRARETARIRKLEEEIRMLRCQAYNVNDNEEISKLLQMLRTICGKFNKLTKTVLEAEAALDTYVPPVAVDNENEITAISHQEEQEINGKDTELGEIFMDDFPALSVVGNDMKTGTPNIFLENWKRAENGESTSGEKIREAGELDRQLDNIFMDNFPGSLKDADGTRMNKKGLKCSTGRSSETQVSDIREFSPFVSIPELSPSYSLQQFIYAQPRTVVSKASIKGVQHFLDVSIIDFLDGISRIESIIAFSGNHVDAKCQSLVADFTNQFTEVYPQLRSFVFALGSSSWLDSLFLICCYQKTCFNCAEDIDSEGYLINRSTINSNRRMRRQLKEVIKLQTWANEVKKSFLEVIPRRTRLDDGDSVEDETADGFCPLYFVISPLQRYLAENNHHYALLCNFIIWPEFRDNLLLNHHSMKAQDIAEILEDLIDQIVLRIRGENGAKDKLFFIKDTLIGVTATQAGYTTALPFGTLLANGLRSPSLWKVTRTFANKYVTTVPKSIVCNIDDTCEKNILKILL